MNKFYKITNQNELDTIQNKLVEKGYKTPNGELLTMDDFKKAYPKNKIYLINAYYNTINKKYEYIGGTKQIYERNYGKKLNLKTKIRRMIIMNSITWLRFGFEEITKEFENANDLIAFMSKDDIRPYVIKAVINDSEFLKVR